MRALFERLRQHQHKAAATGGGAPPLALVSLAACKSGLLDAHKAALLDKARLSKAAALELFTSFAAAPPSSRDKDRALCLPEACAALVAGLKQPSAFVPNLT
jgi:hypothetical protein